MNAEGLAVIRKSDGSPVPCPRDDVGAAVELERLVHELNPEQRDDYVVRLAVVDAVTGEEAASVAFNVRVRKGTSS